MSKSLSLPLFALFGATRGMAGVGAGMLLADRFGRRRRRKLGMTLLAIGAASTLPLLFAVFRGRRRADRPSERSTQGTRSYGFDSVGVDATRYASRGRL